MKEKQSKESKNVPLSEESTVTGSASVPDHVEVEATVPDEPVTVPVIENVSNVDDEPKNQEPAPVPEDLNLTQEAAPEAVVFIAPEEPVTVDQRENLQSNEIVSGTDLDDNTDSNESMEDASNAHAVIRRVRSDPKEEVPAASPNKGFLYSFLDTLRFVSLGLVIGILLVVFVVQRNDVFGSSMEPNLLENDAVFVEMISIHFSDYDYGYIVTIDAEGMEGYSKKEKIIKRVIGKPGDTVEIKDGFVYVNGFLLDESEYLPEGVPTNMSADGTAKGYNNITLGDNEYYCMGDNRGTSLDSRALGPFPQSRIKAHVIAKIYPFDDMKIFN